MIKAGFFETDITPPIGTERPADFMKLRVERISDPLKARAVVFSNGENKVALVGIDTIGFGAGFRKKVEEALPEFKILLNASHTHYGGNLRDKLPCIDEAPEEIRHYALVDSVAHDPLYYAYGIQQVVTAVKMASERLEGVDFSFGRGRVEGLIFNRRIRMKDGHVQTHPGKGNPDALEYAGPVDDELGVVGVWKKGTDQLLGFLLNFSCHACINLEGATSDFPGVAIDTVRRVFGMDAGAVYINGASGDVTQIDNLSLKKDRGKAIAVKLGRCVGAEGIKILATADHGEIGTLSFLSAELPLKRTFPAPEVVEKARQRARLNNGEASFLMAKGIVIQDYVDRHSSSSLVDRVNVVQLGPLVIGSSSGEMFAQYALDFKKASPFPFTWYAQLNGGPLGYIPTPDCFEKSGGGYETATSKFAPETGVEVVGLLGSLVQRLTPEEPPQPETVPPVKQAWSYNFEK